MTTADTTSAGTTKVSLRDLSEAAFRALTAHGASHGEARAAARWCFRPSCTVGGGLVALRDDLAAQPWSRTPVEIVETADGPNRQPGAVELRSPAGNRLLREAPLAVELVTSGGDERVVRVPCAVVGTALLDAVLLEAARVSGTVVAVVIGSARSDGAGLGACGAGWSASVGAPRRQSRDRRRWPSCRGMAAVVGGRRRSGSA